MATTNAAVIEKLFTPELNRIRRRFGLNAVKEVTADLERAVLEAIEKAGGKGRSVTIDAERINWAGIEQGLEKAASTKAARADNRKDAPAVLGTQKLEISFSPDAAALLAAVAAPRQKSMLVNRGGDGNLETITIREQALPTAPVASAATPAAVHPPMRTDDQAHDDFMREQINHTRAPRRLPTGGSTRAGRIPPPQ